MVVVAEDRDIRIEKLDPGSNPWANAYLVTCRQTGESVLVDAPGRVDALLPSLAGRNIKYILMTHNHGDHIGALRGLKSELKVTVAGNEADAHKYPVPLDLYLNDGDTITCGKLKIRAIHTPGHTRGSLCFLVGNYLLAGDTIFPHGPGHTVSPAGFQQILKSLTDKIFVLPDETEVFPGHGDGMVLGKEKKEFRVFSSRTHSPELCGDVLWLES